MTQDGAPGDAIALPVQQEDYDAAQNERQRALQAGRYKSVTVSCENVSTLTWLFHDGNLSCSRVLVQKTICYSSESCAFVT